MRTQLFVGNLVDVFDDVLKIWLLNVLLLLFICIVGAGNIAAGFWKIVLEEFNARTGFTKKSVSVELEVVFYQKFCHFELLHLLISNNILSFWKE